MMSPTTPAPTRAARNPVTADDPTAVCVRSLHITADRDLRYPACAEEPLDRAVDSIFGIGLILQAAIDQHPGVTAQRITEALRRLDEVVREIRNHEFAGPGQDDESGLAWSPPPDVLERSAPTGNRSKLQ